MQRHSCLSILSGFQETQDKSSASARSLSTVLSLALYSPDQRIRACPECVADDMRALMFSYWRCSHQIPGQFLCPRHGCALWHVRETELPPVGPDEVTEYEIPFDETTRLNLERSRPVNTAVAILDSLRREGLMLDRSACVAALRKKLASQEDLASARGTTALGATIEAAFGKAWLQYIMPGTKVGTSSLRHMVKRCMYDSGSRPSYMAMALVAGAAFATPEEALREMGPRPRADDAFAPFHADAH